MQWNIFIMCLFSFCKISLSFKAVLKSSHAVYWMKFTFISSYLLRKVNVTQHIKHINLKDVTVASKCPSSLLFNLQCIISDNVENAQVLKLGPWEYLSVYMFMPFVVRKLLAEIVIQLVCLKVRLCMTVLFFPTANKNEREPKSLHKTGTCVLGCLSHVRLFATL